MSNNLNAHYIPLPSHVMFVLNKCRCSRAPLVTQSSSNNPWLQGVFRIRNRRGKVEKRGGDGEKELRMEKI